LKLSQIKLFTFNAGLFVLDPSVEDFLKSKDAISLDLGATAYINCKAMPAILSELVVKSKANAQSNAGLVAELKAELFKFSAEKQKMIEENAGIASQLHQHSLEVAAMRERAVDSTKTIEALRTENARLQTALKNAFTAPRTTVQMASGDDKLRQSYENLQKEFQKLRSQSIEAITSLKVLEDENEELREELDQLKSQFRNVATSKAG
jgi:predicted  nucleic acid-binding Zn-ribbon protein